MQMNMQPTRHNNILDVFLTNQPLATTNVETAPGISDHEALIVKSDIQHLPKVHQLLKGSLDLSRIHPIDTPVQQLWDSYKAVCVYGLLN